MAEKKGVGHAYNIDFLNVVFAASSLFLFLSVVWMVWDDFDRDWKNTQRRFAAARVPGDAGAAASRRRAPSTRTSCSSSQAQRSRGAEERRGEPGRRSTSCRRSSTDVDIRLFRATRDYQTTKATYDQDRYDFEASRAGGLSSAGEEGAARRGRGEAAERAEPGASRRPTAEQGGDPEAARPVHRPGRRRVGKQIEEHARRADAPAQAARRHRAERW